MHKPWSFDATASNGVAYPFVVIAGLKAHPCPGDVLRLLIVPHPQHAACLEALALHGNGREVALVFGTSLADAERYYYIVTTADEDLVYLMPSDLNNKAMPPPSKFLNEPFNIILPW